MSQNTQKSRTGCPFCEGDAHPIARVFDKSELSLCLLSNPRLVRGHALVTPKRHVEYPGDLTDTELVDIFKQIEQIRHKLLDSGLAEGVDIRQHYRPFLSQSRLKLDHVHWHVLPRRFEDEIYKISSHPESKLFEDLGDEEFQKVKSILLQ